MIEFPLYKINRKKSLIVYVLIVGSLAVALYFLFPKIDFGIFLALLIVFVFYSASKTDNNELIGKIYLTNHQIKVKTESDDFQVNISDLDKLEMTYSGYHGQRLRGDVIGPFNTFSGIDNYLAIVKDKSEFRCRFLVENSKEERELIGLVKNWESSGYDIGNIRMNQ